MDESCIIIKLFESAYNKFIFFVNWGTDYVSRRE